MPNWVKIFLIALSILFVVPIIIAFFVLIQIKSNQVATLSLHPNFNIDIDKINLQSLVDEISNIQNNKRGVLIFISPTYKVTKNGAGVKGSTFMYTETANYFGATVIKVYINQKILSTLDEKKMNESLAYFLIRQILISKGVENYDMNNRIAYKYGISNFGLFRLVHKN